MMKTKRAITVPPSQRRISYNAPTDTVAPVSQGIAVARVNVWNPQTRMAANAKSKIIERMCSPSSAQGE